MALTLSACCAESAPDFVRDVRPLLDAHCVKCHGPEKQKGGLRFDRKESALKIADSGERALVPGHADQSRLVRLVSSRDDDERMPPKGDRLSDSQIELLRRWIDAGANWPDDDASAGRTAREEMVVTDEDRRHWSFLPLGSPAPPAVRNRQSIRTPVDRFVVARLEAKKVALSPPADARTLARRLYFDLLGLPPTPEQVKAFEAALAVDRETAIGALIDELLASPHYGERWARHWLDVVRYADSDGQESDADRPTAYHFRDFVIRALNEDMPFDAFVRWQLAGDEFEPDNPRALAATGFIVAGTHAALPDNLMEEERTRERFNELDDMIATTGSAMLGLTLACARCHDHKYDPVPRRDYYRIQCAFNGGDRAQVPLAPLGEVRRYRAAEKTWQGEFDVAKKSWEEWVAGVRKAREAEARRAKIEALKIDNEGKTALKDDPDGERAKQLAEKFAKELKVEDADLKALLSEAERKDWESRREAFKSVEARRPAALPTAYGFADFGPSPRETFLLARGDFRSRSEPVTLGFLSALTRERKPEDFWNSARTASRRDDTTQQRRAMAEWMTDLDHGSGALAARVIVNRVWQHHFGEGLVRTVNDFGARCDPPTHPELLEWLTRQFVRGGWKLKPLHRLILNSSVYLQASAFDAEKAKVDPENRLVGRMRPRRIEAEILRDSILAVSGTLNPRMFGPAVKGPITEDAIQARNMKDPYPKDLKDTPETRRRSIYMFHKRVVQSPLMQAFDGPDAQASCGRRENTTVAPQALALLNDRFVRARAVDFARRIEQEAGNESGSQIRLAWQIALGREPSADEIGSGVGFLERRQSDRAARDAGLNPSDARRLVLTDLCQTLFALNEFVYVD